MLVEWCQHVILQGWRLPIWVQVVAPEAIDIVGNVGTEGCNRGRINRLTSVLEIMEDLAQGKDVIEHHTVGDQVIILNRLPLGLPLIFRNGALTSKLNPLHKAVERLAFIRRGVNGCAQGLIRKIEQ